MKKNIVVICCLLIVSFFACENDDNSTIPDEGTTPPVVVNFEENFGSPITARFLGNVVDKDSNPIQGAIVRIGNMVVSTDLFGVFSIENVNAFEQFGYITVEKPGYITGSRAVVPSETEVNRVEIMLLEEEVIATVNSDENSIVSLPNGATVTFDGGFVKADGSAHSGAVQVILHHLNPDDENMSAMMPGMLFAQDASGDAVNLETYGMLAVELRSDAGEELQLAEGSVSELRMPVASSATNPPATIPLWYFDEETGYWKEEGQATLQGNTYVGDVTHFSFWNYDFPRPPINLCITLVSLDGNAMTYTPFNLYTYLQSITGYGYTNGNGTDCGLVPVGEELVVVVPSSECNGEVFTTNIGPFNTDTDITITVTTTQASTILSGTFLTCDGNNVTNGYLQLFVDGELEIIPITDGTINYMMNYCGNVNYSVKGIDINNNQTTDLISGTLTGDATLDIGTINACIGFDDTDGDGVFDILEDLNQDANLDNDDTDQDGIPNYQDPDDDGDGVNTADEDYDGDNDPTNDDSDGDGTPDYLDAEDVIVFSAQLQSDTCTDPQVFDLSALSTNLGDSLHTYVYYATEADANAETNPLPASYSVSLASLLSGTTIYVKATNNTSSQSAIGEVTLLSNTQDTDGDGLSDCEELTGLDDPLTGAIPSGTSDPNDPNDPTATPVTVYITMPETISESIGQLPVTFNLGAISDVDTVINVGTTSLSAQHGSDYIGIGTTITIPAGQLSEVVNITIIDDTNTYSEEQHERFRVNGIVASGNTTITDVHAVVTIHNDDLFSFYMFDSFGYEDDGSIEVKIGFTVPIYVDAVFSFSTTPGTATSNDYSLSTTTLVIPAGETIGSFFVTPTNDGVLEATESFQISATMTSGPLSGTLTREVFIYDDNTDYRDMADGIGCDFSTAAIGEIDLTTLNDHLLNGNPGTISYFQEGVAGQVSQINSPETYGYDTVHSNPLWARIDTPTGIIDNIPIDMQVSTWLVLGSSTLWVSVCDSTDGNPSNGLGVMNLVAFFRGSFQFFINQMKGLEMTFYTDQLDAESGINAITLPENYTTTTQNIYVRIEEPFTGCYKVRTIQVQVNSGC